MFSIRTSIVRSLDYRPFFSWRFVRELHTSGNFRPLKAASSFLARGKRPEIIDDPDSKDFLIDRVNWLKLPTPSLGITMSDIFMIVHFQLEM